MYNPDFQCEILIEKIYMTWKKKNGQVILTYIEFWFTKVYFHLKPKG